MNGNNIGVLGQDPAQEIYQHIGGPQQFFLNPQQEDMLMETLLRRFPGLSELAPSRDAEPPEDPYLEVKGGGDIDDGVLNGFTAEVNFEDPHKSADEDVVYEVAIKDRSKVSTPIIHRFLSSPGRKQCTELPHLDPGAYDLKLRAKRKNHTSPWVQVRDVPNTQVTSDNVAYLWHFDTYVENLIGVKYSAKVGSMEIADGIFHKALYLKNAISYLDYSIPDRPGFGASDSGRISFWFRSDTDWDDAGTPTTRKILQFTGGDTLYVWLHKTTGYLYITAPTAQYWVQCKHKANEWVYISIAWSKDKIWVSCNGHTEEYDSRESCTPGTTLRIGDSSLGFQGSISELIIETTAARAYMTQAPKLPYYDERERVRKALLKQDNEDDVRLAGNVRFLKELIVDDKLGIGVSSPSCGLELYRSTSSEIIGFKFQLTKIGTNASTLRGGSMTLNTSGGSGTQVNAEGVFGEILNSAPGITIEHARALSARVRNTSSGTIINAYGVRIEDAVNSGGGTLTNSYGIYIKNIATGSNSNYSLYSAGGMAYHAGKIGIGITVPTEMLDVAGSIKATQGIKSVAGETLLDCANKQLKEIGGDVIVNLAGSGSGGGWTVDLAEDFYNATLFKNSPASGFPTILKAYCNDGLAWAIQAGSPANTTVLVSEIHDFMIEPRCQAGSLITLGACQVAAQPPGSVADTQGKLRVSARGGTQTAYYLDLLAAAGTSKIEFDTDADRYSFLGSSAEWLRFTANGVELKGTNRRMIFDTGDLIEYNTGGNTFKLQVGSADIFSIAQGGINLLGSLGRRITFDTGDFMDYDTTDNELDIAINNLISFTIGAEYAKLRYTTTGLPAASSAHVGELWMVEESGVGTDRYCRLYLCMKTDVATYCWHLIAEETWNVAS